MGLPPHKRMHSRGKGPGKGPGKGLGKGPGEGPDMTPARVPGSALARAIQGPKGSGKIPGKGARKGPGILPKQSHLPSALGLAVGAAPAQAIARSAPGAAALSYAVGVPTKPQGPESRKRARASTKARERASTKAWQQQGP